MQNARLHVKHLANSMLIPRWQVQNTTNGMGNARLQVQNAANRMGSGRHWPRPKNLKKDPKRTKTIPHPKKRNLLPLCVIFSRHFSIYIWSATTLSIAAVIVLPRIKFRRQKKAQRSRWRCFPAIRPIAKFNATATCVYVLHDPSNSAWRDIQYSFCGPKMEYSNEFLRQDACLGTPSCRYHWREAARRDEIVKQLEVLADSFGAFVWWIRHSYCAATDFQCIYPVWWKAHCWNCICILGNLWHVASSYEFVTHHRAIPSADLCLRDAHRETLKRWRSWPPSQWGQFHPGSSHEKHLGTRADRKCTVSMAQNQRRRLRSRICSTTTTTRKSEMLRTIPSQTSALRSFAGDTGSAHEHNHTSTCPTSIYQDITNLARKVCFGDRPSGCRKEHFVVCHSGRSAAGDWNSWVARFHCLLLTDSVDPARHCATQYHLRWIVWWREIFQGHWSMFLGSWLETACQWCRNDHWRERQVF